MGSAFAPHSILIGTDIAAGIAGRDLYLAKKDKQYMRKVLAYPGLELPNFVKRRLHTGDTLDVFEVIVDVGTQLLRGGEWCPAAGSVGTDAFQYFGKGGELLLFEKVDIRHLPSQLFQLCPLHLLVCCVIDRRFGFGNDLNPGVDDKAAMWLRMGKGADLVAIVVLIDFNQRFAGDSKFLRKHFLV